MADPDQQLRVLALFLSCAILHLIMRRLSSVERQLAGAPPADRADDDLSMDAIARGLPLDGWRLAKSVDGGKLRCYTRADGAGEFGFRFVSEIDVAGAAECMALPRETDLIPEWNIFCEAAEIVRLDSPTELWAQAILKLPWPVPRHLVRLHATLHDRVERDGCFVCHTATPPDFPETSDDPRYAACASHQLPLRLGVGRLVPLPEAVAGVPRTAADIVMLIDLNQVRYLRGLGGHLPQWLVDVVLAIMVPWLWRMALQLLADMGGDNALARRLRADESGVYAQIRRACRQPAVPPREGTM